MGCDAVETNTFGGMPWTLREFELEGYDAVRVASAGTKFPNLADLEVREALDRICEASGRNHKETPMQVKDLKTLAELKEHAPAVHTALLALALSDASAEITESAVTEAVEAANSKLAEAEQKVRDLELQRDAGNDALTRLSERVEVMEADAAKRDLRSEVTEAVTEGAKGRAGGALLLTQVMQDFDAGRVPSVEEAMTELTRKAALVESVAGIAPTPAPGTDEPVQPGDDGGVAENAPGPEKASDGIAELME